jgi:hypothetical protein
MHIPVIITVAITCAEGSPYRQMVNEFDDPQPTADRLRTQLAPR